MVQSNSSPALHQATQLSQQQLMFNAQQKLQGFQGQPVVYNSQTAPAYNSQTAPVYNSKTTPVYNSQQPVTRNQQPHGQHYYQSQQEQYYNNTETNQATTQGVDNLIFSGQFNEAFNNNSSVSQSPQLIQLDRNNVKKTQQDVTDNASNTMFKKPPIPPQKPKFPVSTSVQVWLHINL